MENLTEKTLLKLGFKKNHVSAKESGNTSFDYFVLDLGENACLISNASDETKNDCYRINLFDHPNLGVCKTEEEVKILYKALTQKDLKPNHL